MTCIVGWVDDGRIVMGGDSAGVAGYSLTVRADTKVFRNGPMLFGFTDSFRMGDLLRFSLTIPDHDPRVDDRKYLATTFVDAVRACLKTGGFASKNNEVERGGNFLLGYKGRIYEIGSDYQVGAPLDGYAAVGCGFEIALGALYALRSVRAVDARERVETALAAAERFSAGVRRPFHLEELSS